MIAMIILVTLAILGFISMCCESSEEYNIRQKHEQQVKIDAQISAVEFARTMDTLAVQGNTQTYKSLKNKGMIK